MKLQITPGKCILCCLCETFAPQVFTQTEIIEIDIEAAKRYTDEVITAAYCCPVNCIELEFS